MIEAASLATYRRRENFVTVLLLAGGLLLAVLLAALVSGLTPKGGGPLPALMVLIALLVAPCIWRWPQLGAYMLLAAAVMIEEQPIGWGLSLTDKIPAFQDLQSITGLRGLWLNPVELLALFSLAVVMLKARVTGQKFRGGPLALPFTLLTSLLVLALLRGHAAGGDLLIALWGIRGLDLMLFAYLLTANVIKTRGQIRVLGAIFIAGVALKALIGAWRYAIDIHGNLSSISDGLGGGNSLMAHEESFFFSLALLAALLAFILVLAKRDRRWLVFSALLVMLPLLANQRRAAVAGLVLGLVLLPVMLRAFDLRLAKKMTRGLIIAGILLTPYFIVGWSQKAVWSAPVQAVRSGIDPNQRDASSNKYRDIENADLKATARQDPLLGVGFGVPMIQKVALPNISASYGWYLYLPHNNLLWLGMTMGLLGVVAFAYLVVAVVRQGMTALIEAPDAEMRLVYIFGLLALVLYLTFALLDQGLLSQRIGVFMGVQLGLLAFASRQREEEPVLQREGRLTR